MFFYSFSKLHDSFMNMLGGVSMTTTSLLVLPPEERNRIVKLHRSKKVSLEKKNSLRNVFGCTVTCIVLLLFPKSHWILNSPRIAAQVHY